MTLIPCGIKHQTLEDCRSEKKLLLETAPTACILEHPFLDPQG